MNDFQIDQKERLAVGRQLELLAISHSKTDNPAMRSMIDAKARITINNRLSQHPATDYHLEKYEEAKQCLRRLK